MSKRTTLPVLAGLLAATLVPSCRESVSPERRDRPAAAFAAAASGIELDQQNGALGPTNSTVIRKGFNDTNPRLGSAIIATFYWLGSTNIIPTVSDLLADGTPVGNTYHLVTNVSADNIAMATFVATNVQNFPEGTFPTGEKILVVEATFSAQIADGGVLISSYTGVDPVFAQAFGGFAAASGSGSAPTIAHPGAIGVNAGALAYGATMANVVVGLTPPADFTPLNGGPMSNTAIKTDGDFAVRASAGLVDPQWTWDFDQGHPGTWLASAIALNPAPPPAATHLVFTVQPSNTTAGGTISPAVQVAAQDDAGTTVVGFGGDITIALGTNPGGGTLSGTATVTAANGVATFSNLSIDKVGNGYTLAATATGLTGATSAQFNIAAPPQARAQVSGGGRIDPSIGKTTFGFNMDGRSGPPFQGEMQVVYHGGTSAMTRIHSLVIDGLTSSPDPRGGVCITWTGSARINNSDQRRFTATACDNGQPGSSHGTGPDRFGISVDGSISTGLTDLKGGNTHARP